MDQYAVRGSYRRIETQNMEHEKLENSGERHEKSFSHSTGKAVSFQPSAFGARDQGSGHEIG
jgi:hypothetical protein